MRDDKADGSGAAHCLFERQLAQATRSHGAIDLAQLAGQVSLTYEQLERARQGTDRRNASFSRELASVNRELQRAIAELEVQNLRFAAALENMAQGLCFFDGAQRLIVCNKLYAEIYGLRPEHVQPGTTLRQIVEHRWRIGSAPAMAQPEYLEWRDRISSAAMPSETSVELRNGRIIAIRHQPMPDGGWVATHEDITERRMAEKRIAYMAHHDHLTGLANRTLVRERLDEALARARHGEGCALLCIDLDYFKVVNDTLGHKAGDELLQAAAARMQRHLRDADMLARLGGDEFAVLQLDMAHSEAPAVLAERLVQVLSAPFDLNGHQAVISASIGIASAPADGMEAETLLKNADIALYQAKSGGRRRHCHFTPEMDRAVQVRRSLELDLRHAAAQESFELHYQPLLDVATREISAFEALLRWSHPVRGNIPPSEFIPLAEELGLITPIGDWVLRRACAQAAAWPETVGIAVNISAVQFRDPHLAETIAAAIQEAGIAASRLEIEITESVMLESGPATHGTLRALRAMGIRIAMDDFGIGFSSLSSLRNFPFDKVKIDQSFVRELTPRPDTIAIIRALIGICASLGMATTVEGVETEEQLAILAAERCTSVQGYLFSRPRPAHELPELLRLFGHGAHAAGRTP